MFVSRHRRPNAVHQTPAAALPLPAGRGGRNPEEGCHSLERARRTTNNRSVISCGGPSVYSWRRPTTNSARTFKATGWFSSVPANHGTANALPKVIMWGFGAAAATPPSVAAANIHRPTAPRLALALRLSALIFRYPIHASRTQIESNQQSDGETRSWVTNREALFQSGNNSAATI